MAAARVEQLNRTPSPLPFPGPALRALRGAACLACALLLAAGAQAAPQRAAGAKAGTTLKGKAARAAKVQAPASSLKSRRAAAGAAAVAAGAAGGAMVLKASPGRDGDAEARLIEIYRLIGTAQQRPALQKAEALVRDHPNFQLAQLVHGDLLAARQRPLRAVGDVPDAAARAAPQLLAELREESQLRMRALRERPPEGAIPPQFLQLSPRSRHAIAVDASRSRLYLFENGRNGLKLLADYYISVGKAGVDKLAEGDARTPLGVYYITSNLDPKSLKDFYGAGALPINYPNPLDQRLGRTGSGIWLHGTPPQQFSRAPRASDGCVVLANPDLLRIIRTVEVRTTPVVIARQLEWVAPEKLRADQQRFQGVLEAWRTARSSGNVERLRGFYTDDVVIDGKPIAALPALQTVELKRNPAMEIELKDVSVLRWDHQGETMVVTFGEVVQGRRTGPTKRQYWQRQGPHWKIFFEGVIG